jgi:hypothetical protein
MHYRGLEAGGGDIAFYVSVTFPGRSVTLGSHT